MFVRNDGSCERERPAADRTALSKLVIRHALDLQRRSPGKRWIQEFPCQSAQVDQRGGVVGIRDGNFLALPRQTRPKPTGLALVLRPLGVEVIGVEPTTAKHALIGLKYTPGLPPGLIPRNLRIDLLSAVAFVSDDEALAMTHLLVRSGFLFGPSTGAVCVAARDFAAGLDGRPARFVLIGHDSATHYPKLFPAMPDRTV